MDFAAGFATGFAFAKKMFDGGGGGGSDIYITDYGSSLIVTTITGRGSELPKTSDHKFTFTTQIFKIVTTAKSSTKKSTRTWSKTVITSVANDKGIVIWTLSPDASGKITAVYDVNGNEILNGVTNGDSTITQTPEGVALGYALAYNNEKDTLLDELIKAYENGVDDEEEIDDGGDTTIETIDFQGSGAVLKKYNKKGLLSTIYYGDYGVFKGVTDTQFDVFFPYHRSTVYATVNMTFDGEYKHVGDVLYETNKDDSIAYTHYIPSYDATRLYFGDWFYEDGTPAITDGITDI